MVEVIENVKVVACWRQENDNNLKCKLTFDIKKSTEKDTILRKYIENIEYLSMENTVTKYQEYGNEVWTFDYHDKPTKCEIAGVKYKNNFLICGEE